ncbi:anti-ECFsigma factor, ChrR [Thalassococcus halodurans]|uniref:Anti-ECFsigma factor, ChrR n=1 Tax=Thalassococcus halodurans TaxID=373675 RepID=A0A1H6BZW2_9RHOB|nr:ChrR family anti-sigma-E factor [Thalassococcus halodurans]SEG65975.1 anti-ECFsigma factor, ChrR [Thalassococcus halodurans]
MIKHHLTEDLLMAYSAGALSEAFSLAVATHISLCDECRAAAESYDAVGGAVMVSTDAAPVSDSCLSNTLAAIRDADVEAPTPRMKDAVLPSPLAEYVGGGLDKIKWKSAGMGVKQAVLATNDDAVARLLYIPAGTAVPDHGHGGLELTCVLQGAFRDEDMRFARGDIEVATEEVDHTPIADISEDCICLAVTDAPLKFKGWLPRLAQPFLGI